MKSKFTHFYVGFAILFLFCSNSFNPPNNYTGSPASPSNRTCANCHGGGNFNGDVMITGLPATITPNMTYNITVTSSYPAGGTAPNRAGFQLDVVGNGGTTIGTLANPGPSSTVGSNLFEHFPAVTFGAANSVSWSADWTAPAGPSGEIITMYTSSVIANGSGTSGDQVVNNNVSGTLMGGGSTISVTIPSSTDVVCFGDDTGSATAMASGGSGNYGYAWSSGANMATVNNLTAGTYTVTATDNTAGGTATAMITINQPSSALSVSIVNSTDIDCSNPTGTAGASALGGTPSYNYMWSTGANGQSVVLPAGTHIVTATDANMCQETAMVTISENTTPPTATGGPDMQIDCNNSTATLAGSGETGANITIQWTTSDGIINSGGNTYTPNVGAGTYMLTVTNTMNGCQTTDQVLVSTNTTPPIAIAMAGQLDCNNTIVTLDGIGSSTGNVAYNWSGPNILSGANSIMATTDTPGSYVFTVTDNDNGCTTSFTVSVIQDTTPPNANAGADMQIDCNNSTVVLDASASSPLGNIFYSWSTSNGNIIFGGNTSMPTVNSGGTYIVLITDDTNGCTDTDEVIVTENAIMPTAEAGSDIVINCVNTQVTLDGTGSSTGANFSYNWTGPGIVSGGNTLNPVVNIEGTYCIEVIDNTNNCSSMDCVVVTEDVQLPIVNINPPNLITCTNTCITLDGSGSSSEANFVYQWATTDGMINSGPDTLFPEVCASGTYTLIVTNTANGCAASQDVMVSENTIAPTVSINISGELNCNNTSVILTASSSANNSSFQWSGPDNFMSNIANPIITIAGTYTVVVIDDENGCTEEVSAIVVEADEPTVTITAQTNIDCNGNMTGSATAQGAGGTGVLTYMWPSGGMMPTENGLLAGMYVVVVTDENGCTASVDVIITEPSILLANASATGVSSAGAMDGITTANPSGGTPDYAYNWSNVGMTQTISDLPAGNYTVTVTDSNNCTAEETVTVSSFDCGSVSIDFSTTDVTCNGGDDGSATVIVNNGASPITYQWSTGGMTETISNLEAGTYDVTIIDGNNCEVTGSVTIGEPTAIMGMVDEVVDVSCNSGNDGAAMVSATGGTGMLTFQWNDTDMQTGTTAMNLSAGNYIVVVTDENDCFIEIPVNITEPPLIILSVTTTDETANMSADGTATANVEGGTPGYTFLWNNSETTQMIENLISGEYCVTITDSNACTVSACGMVSPFGCATSQTIVNTAPVSCFGGNDGMATLSSFGGAEPYTYLWENGQVGDVLNNLSAGTYSVTCTDAASCDNVVEVTITEPSELTLSVINKGDVTCEGEDDGFISVNASGGILGYSYEWNTGDETTMIANLAPGVYTCTVTDPNDCTTSVTVEIVLIPDTQAPTILVNNLNVYLDDNGMASITAEMVDAGSFDNCEIVSIEVGPEDFNCSMTGTNIATFVALDAAGNCDFDTAFIMVLDTISPVLACPEDINLVGCNLVVEYDAPTATDNCGVGTPFLFDGLPSGATFPAGTTTVSWGANDDSNNAGTCSFNVILEAEMVMTTTATEPVCAGFEDGTATVEAIGGAEPYTYQWNDPAMQTTQTAVGLTAGEYEVTVTDATGCSAVTTVVVSEPDPITIEFTTVTNETNTDMNGAVDVTIIGGSGGDFMYQWFLDGNLVSEMEDIDGISTGEYVLFVTDETDCSTSDTVFVDMVVATENFELEKSASISPNPTTGIVNLDIDLDAEAEIAITVFDFTGKEILNLPTQSISDKTIPMDLSQYSEGVYLIRVEIEEDVLLRRVVVQY